MFFTLEWVVIVCGITVCFLGFYDLDFVVYVVFVAMLTLVWVVDFVLLMDVFCFEMIVEVFGCGLFL